MREFQDERDQCVIFLLDCGRRMRADEGAAGAAAAATSTRRSNALMLLAYVALKEGDEVGAHDLRQRRRPQRRDFAPRKGGATLERADAPRCTTSSRGATHSDYLVAAQRAAARACASARWWSC